MAYKSNTVTNYCGQMNKKKKKLKYFAFVYRRCWENWVSLPQIIFVTFYVNSTDISNSIEK